jgi:hypothetical protein
MFVVKCLIELKYCTSGSSIVAVEKDQVPDPLVLHEMWALQSVQAPEVR